MKFTAQLILIILFIPIFLLSVFSATVRFQFLKPNFWLTSFEKNNVYTGLALTLQNATENQIETEGGSRTEVKVLTGLITPENLKETIEKNLTNILNFANGKSGELVFYIPIQKIPKSLLPNNIGLLSEEMTAETLLQKFNVQGINKSQIETLKRVGMQSNYFFILNISVAILILIVLAVLVAKGGKFVAPAMALLPSGIITLLIVGLGYVIRMSMTTDWVKSSEPSQNILSTFAPYILQEVLHLWLYIGIGAIIIGIVLLFIKKR